MSIIIPSNVQFIEDIDVSKLKWDELCMNPSESMAELLEANLDKINWKKLLTNGSASAGEVIIRHIDKVIDIDNWDKFCANPLAIPYLKQYPTNINWYWLLLNPNPEALDIIMAMPHKINWAVFSSNPISVRFLKEHPERILWHHFASISTPEAIEVIRENLHQFIEPNTDDPSKEHKIYNFWKALSSNPSAIDILETYPERICWLELSKNPNAVHLLKENTGRINWAHLHFNPNPEAMELFEANPTKINWEKLSKKPYALGLLERNPDKIKWKRLCANPEGLTLFMSINSKQKRRYWGELSSNPDIFVKNPYDYVLK